MPARAGTLLANHSSSLALAIVILASTYLSLVFGELVPKRLALNNPERVASAVARPMHLVAVVTSPVVRLLSGSTGLVLRLLGARRPKNRRLPRRRSG